MKKEILLLANAILLLALIFVLTINDKKYSPICDCSEKILETEEVFGCNIENPDSDGYLLKICEYLNENSINSHKTPNEYNIVKIEEEEYLVSDIFNFTFVKIYLDGGPGAGDIALIDKKTKEVVGFSVADW